jgi:dTDP-4-amino-4,6-dideoxygalactose transaminase
MPMKIPLLDLNAQNLPLEAELTAAFTRVLRSGVFVMGPEVAAFEKEVAALVGTTHAIGVSSGTDALLLALMALDLGPGDEVLVPSFTFFATAGCVARTGATPVFVDACPVCFNLDTTRAAQKITARTKAIIPVHLFGQCADMDAVMALASAHGLRVIEDAAQSIGARSKNRASGTIGDFGTYSFFPSKNLGGFGDGGMLVTDDDALADRARLLRTHGSRPKYFHSLIGGNFRLDPLQAALLRVKLPHYASYTAARQANAAAYTASLSRLPGVVAADPAHCQCLESQDRALDTAGARLVLPIAYPHNEHIWNQYTVRVPGPGARDALKNHLQQHDIGCEIYYPRTMDQQVCFASTPEASRTDCAVAHRLAAESLSLPIYPELPAAHRDGVVEAIASFLASSPSPASALFP